MPSSNVMEKFEAGHLHSGRKNGPIVTNPKQAIAIKMSEQREERKHGGRYPEHHASLRSVSRRERHRKS